MINPRSTVCAIPTRRSATVKLITRRKVLFKFNTMNPENKYSKGIGDDNESRQDKKNDQNRYRCHIGHGKIIFFKGDIVDLTVLKESLLTNRYETTDQS